MFMAESRETWTFILEVGFRAAIHAERHQRDMRWWAGLWR